MIGRCSNLLGANRSVLTPTLLAALNTGCVKRTAYYVVTNSGKIPNPATTDKDYRVLLQVVPFAPNVGRNFHSVCEAHTRDLAESGIWLPGRNCLYLQTYPSFLRSASAFDQPVGKRVKLKAERRSLRLLSTLLTGLADQLVNRWH